MCVHACVHVYIHNHFTYTTTWLAVLQLPGCSTAPLLRRRAVANNLAGRLCCLVPLLLPTKDAARRLSYYMHTGAVGLSALGRRSRRLIAGTVDVLQEAL